ncbi:hypothetical protein ACFLTH_04000 [Bacteroidota bacterium]
MKRIKLLALILVILSLTLTSNAQQVSESNESENEGTYEELPFNLSVFYPLSMNKSDDVVTNFNLSLLYGRVGSVSGVELGGLVNYVKRDVSGLEISGIVNIVGTGLQGWQMAGIYNYVGGDASFLQDAGIANLVEGDFTGAQFAGITNILKGELNGLQSAVVNIAGDVYGAQMGTVNIGAAVSGVQIGVINIADKIDGIPIGLINIAKEGNVHALVWGSNVILMNVGVKFAVNDYFYSILSGGYNNNSKNLAKSLAVGYHMGLHFPVQDNFYLETDIGGYTVDNAELFKAAEGTVNQNMLQIRLMAGYQISEKLSIFGGIGNNYSVDNNQKFVDGKNEIMFMAGLQLF